MASGCDSHEYYDACSYILGHPGKITFTMSQLIRIMFGLSRDPKFQQSQVCSCILFFFKHELQIIVGCPRCVMERTVFLLRGLKRHSSKTHPSAITREIHLCPAPKIHHSTQCTNTAWRYDAHPRGNFGFNTAGVIRGWNNIVSVSCVVGWEAITDTDESRIDCRNVIGLVCVFILFIFVFGVHNFKPKYPPDQI